MFQKLISSVYVKNTIFMKSVKLAGFHSLTCVTVGLIALNTSPFVLLLTNETG
jgi:hypothetical protein